MPKGRVPSASKIWPGLGMVFRGMQRKAERFLPRSISWSISARIRVPQSTNVANSWRW